MKVKGLTLLLVLVFVCSTQVSGKFSGKSLHQVLGQQVVSVLAKNKDAESTSGIDYYWKQAQSNCKQQVSDIIQYGMFERQLGNLTKCMFEKNQQDVKNCKNNFLNQIILPIQEQMKAECDHLIQKEKLKKQMFKSQLAKKPSGSFLV